ncbi:conserved hypothetical protein [Streptomyces viridochromogenes DSM 40736]|uniref:Uncharacterized protein n=1 Tax=Streptomyces viridochromogenes (strain DSM 40736 / JCM 4977 / BCRC 1201 / Tue 494) TaxID=591159 RepID=D9XB60_STRVT|nr:conserved hypothetical protein [Streptomyces viridochromogenes DSM 40736]
MGATAITAAAAAGARGRDVPDVAMVVTGGSGRARAVRSGEPVFARLWQLLQPEHTETERVPEAWGEGRFPPIRLTVVWRLSGVGGRPSTNRPPGGDVAVERQDQLFVAEDGTPWVRSDPAPAVEDDDIRRHRAPRSVFQRLDLARLAGDSATAGGPGGSTAAGDLSGPVRGDVRWAAVGLVAGLAAGVGGMLPARRVAARREAGPPREEPRQVLIDLDE